MVIHGFTGARRRCAIAAAAVAAVTAAGCGVAPPAPPTRGGPPVIVIRDSANGTMVPVAAGDRVELILSSSYWDVAGGSAPRVLRQDGPATPMPRPSSCPENIPGLGCIPIQMKFTALAARQGRHQGEPYFLRRSLAVRLGPDAVHRHGRRQGPGVMVPPGSPP